MRNFGSNLGAEIPIASRNKYSGVMFLEEDFFREPYSWGIKFRADVFLGIFFQGGFIPLAMNSRAFFPTLIKKNRAFAIAQNSLLLTSIFEVLSFGQFWNNSVGIYSFSVFSKPARMRSTPVLNILEKFSVKVYTFGILGIYFKECTVRFAV